MVILLIIVVLAALIFGGTFAFVYFRYDVNIFNRCENGNDILMAIPGWANVHPLLKVIPVEWEHCIPYGILHSPQPTELVKRFLSAAQAAVKDPCGQGNRCIKEIR